MDMDTPAGVLSPTIVTMATNVGPTARPPTGTNDQVIIAAHTNLLKQE
jgi:hypothetical protein